MTFGYPPRRKPPTPLPPSLEVLEQELAGTFPDRAELSATYGLKEAAEFDPAVSYPQSSLVKRNGTVFYRTQETPAAPTTLTNHHLNPRFRNNRAGWSAGSGVTATVEGNRVRLTLTAEKTVGSSLLFEGETATVEGAVWSGAMTVEVPRAAASGVALRVSVNAYPTTTVVKLTDLTVAPGTVATIKAESGIIPTGKTGVRSVLSAAATLPVGTEIIVSAPILVNDIMVEGFWDGDSPATEASEHSWTGTRHASTSVRTTVYDRPGTSDAWALVTPAPRPTRVNSPALFRPTVEGDNVVRYPGTIDGSRTRMWSYQAASLAITTDDTDTWTVIHTFTNPVRSLRCMDNGELIVSTRSTDNLQPHELWLSTGMQADPATATWTKAMDGLTAGNGPTNGWSWSVHGPIVAVADYGTKAGANNARHAYLSADYGRTWRTIFDLGTKVGNHLHGIVWDPYWDRLWITYGDDTSGILYSDDLGSTWRVAQSSADVNGRWQVVGGIALPDCILFGSDGDPNGIVRIPRSQGKYPAGGTYTPEEAYKLNNTTTITHLCHSIYQAPRPGNDAPVVFGFGPEVVEGTSRVLVTTDGYDFREVWADPLTTPAGRGVQMAFGPTARGNLVLNSNDARYGSGMTRWRGPFPAAY